MASCLVSSHVFWEQIAGEKADTDAVAKWLKGLTKNDRLLVSELSFGTVLTEIENLHEPNEREWFKKELKDIERKYAGNIADFNREAIDKWGLIRLSKPKGASPLPAEETQLIAIAMVNDFTYVGVRGPVHQHLKVKMFDPWQDATWPLP
jgi:hypothetical protein